MSNIIDTAVTRKGQIATLDIERPVKMKKGYAPAIKRSTVQVRLGVNYDNIAKVQDKRESGELPSENAGLPYGEWVIPNLLLAHNGKRYLRCATIKSTMKVQPKYYRNGIEVSPEVLKPEALASEFVERDELDVFNINIDNIKAIR